MKPMTFAAIFACIIVAPSASDAQLVVDPDDLALSAIGTCESNTGPVDLGRAWFLENREVQLGDDLQVRLGSLSVAIDRVDGEPDRRVYNISAILGEDMEADPDIALKFALLDGVLAVYWREPAFNRNYRQGLFRIEGGTLMNWCQGEGGIYRSH